MLQYRVDIQGRYQGQDIVNTYMYVEGDPLGDRSLLWRTGVDQGPPPSSERLNAIASGITTLFQTAYESLSVAAVTYSILRVTSLSPNPDKRTVLTLGIAWTGIHAVAGVVSSQSAVVTRRPLPGGRKLNGRVYYGAFPQADVADGAIINASGTHFALGDLRDAMATPFVLGGALGASLLQPAVINFRRRELLYQLFPYWGFQAGQCQIKLPLRTQRRRRPGHGRTG